MEKHFSHHHLWFRVASHSSFKQRQSPKIGTNLNPAKPTTCPRIEVWQTNSGQFWCLLHDSLYTMTEFD